MIVRCPECAEELTISPDMAGQAAACAHCDSQFLVPAAVARKARATRRRQAPSPRKSSSKLGGLKKTCQNCGMQFSVSHPRCPDCGIRYRAGDHGGITRKTQVERSRGTNMTIGIVLIAGGVIAFVWGLTQGYIWYGIPGLMIVLGIGSLAA